MKGTVHVRVNRDGSKSYVCQVKLGRDPGTGKARVFTITAGRRARGGRRPERGPHRIVRVG